MNKSYIVSGVMFGDEGKGTLVDYLSDKYNLKENVRYNGGSQASHTVISDGITHKFSQLGSSFMNPNTRTFLSENTIVNLFNIISEAKVLSEKKHLQPEELLQRIYVSKDALIVTPYHSLINKVRELSSKNNRLGTVGTGVSEVIRLKNETGLYLTVDDLLTDSGYQKLLALFDYTSQYIKEKRKLIPDDLFTKLIDEKDLYFLTDERNREYIYRCYNNLLKSELFHIITDINEFHHPDNNIVFEGSQGVLIDKEYGIKPNTTALDTTNTYGIKLANKIASNYHTFGAISAFNSRHGFGILPTYDPYLQKNIFDENQQSSYFQGSPRYGWFDAVLARYSLKMNQTDELFMSGLDRLSNMENVKICNSYIYTGEIDDEFLKTFSFYSDNNRLIISDILNNSPHLRRYLSKCIPMYIELNGWQKDISQQDDYYSLPITCHDYVSLIELLIHHNISLVGVGPDRQQKLVRRKL